MLTYLIKRLIGAVPTLFLLLALTFFLVRLAPGGPFDTEQAWPPEIQANILQQYELDKPVAIQFAHWLRDLSHGDLRESFQYLGNPVSQVIAESFPISLTLGLWALAIAVLIGIPLGCWAAWKQNTISDTLISFFAVSGISLPTYLVASILVVIFALWLNWLPPALWENPTSAVLPILALSWRPLAIVIRFTRSSMLETLSSDYIRTAFGKGLSPSQVVFKHALKNSLIPVMTVIGPIAANLITGSFLIEMIFQIPGMGKHFVQAVMNRDYPLVMGVALTYGIVLITSNLLVDLGYALADPRIRLETRS